MQIVVGETMLDNANTMPHEERSLMYDALMAVKPPGLSVNAWTVRAGVGRSIFTEIRRHGNPTTETLQKLLGAIDVSLADFEAGNATVRTEVRGTGMTAGQAHDAWTMPGQSKAVPVLGSAWGGQFDDIEEVDTTELRLAEILDYLARPPSLSDDPDAYAVAIVGESMAPRFEPGEYAFVSPRSPPRVGDDVIVQLRAPEEEGSDVGGQITEVLIKRLVRQSATFIELRQFNPDKTFRVPRERVRRIHRVKGRM